MHLPSRSLKLLPMLGVPSLPSLFMPGLSRANSALCRGLNAPVAGPPEGEYGAVTVPARRFCLRPAKAPWMAGEPLPARGLFPPVPSSPSVLRASLAEVKDESMVAARTGCLPAATADIGGREARGESAVV